MVINVHERTIAAGRHEVGELLADLGTPHDRLWPRRWPPMQFDGPVEVGARGGHGPIRYAVVSRRPGRRVVFRFERPTGFRGTHAFVVHDVDAAHTVIQHRLEMRVRGRARVSWFVLWRPLHDALLEDCLDRAGAELASAPPTASWSPYVRLLRRLAARGGVR